MSETTRVKVTELLYSSRNGIGGGAFPPVDPALGEVRITSIGYHFNLTILG